MTNKIRVVIVSEFFPRSASGEARGGVEMRCWHIAQRLTADYEVTVVTSREPKLADNDHFGDIQVLRRGPEREYSQTGSLFKRFQFMLDVYKTIRSLQPTIVDAQSYVAYLPAYCAAKKVGAVTVATYHDVWKGRWIKLFGATGFIGEIYERICLSRSWDQFIANSNYTKSNLISAGVPESKVAVIPNGIDFNSIDNINVEKYATPTICSITRMVSYKRVVDLIHAVELIQKSIPDIQCKIIGTGPEFKAIKDEIRKKKLTEHIELLGFVSSSDEVIKVLKRSHVFCLPSEIEGFGIVVAEAMACRVPVVATTIDPIKEVTGNGSAALLVEPRGVKGLSHAIQTVLRDKDLSNKLVSIGREIAEQYNWDRISDEVIKIYKKATE